MSAEACDLDLGLPPVKGQMDYTHPADSGLLQRRMPKGNAWLVWLLVTATAIALLGLAIYLPALMYPALSTNTLNHLHISPQARISIQDEKFTLQNAARTSLIQIIAGIAVLSGATVGWRQLRHSISDAQAQRKAQRQTLHLEHYSKAIQYIGDTSATVRLGGVHLLAMLADTSADHRAAVSNVLASFISNRSPWPPGEEAPPIGAAPGRLTALGARAPDIQGAMTAIGTYGGLRQGHALLRLMRCDLRAADLIGACLDDVNFTAAHLEAAELQNAHLARATLTEACLSGADLTDADLSQADLRGADLSQSITTGIKLNGAVFNVSTVWPRELTATDAKRLGAQRDA